MAIYPKDTLEGHLEEHGGRVDRPIAQYNGVANDGVVALKVKDG
jgi:hypothetical protein